MQSEETKKEYRKTITKLAKEALADHILSPEQENGPVRMWLCHRPGSGMYHFRVVAGPGMLLVYGDVGDHMLQNHDKDMVKWLVDGAINSIEYLISKFTHRPRIFFPREAVLLLDSMVDDAFDDREREHMANLRSRVLDEWSPEIESGNGHDFAEAFYEAGGDVECVDQTFDYDSGVYWTVECLKRFVELYNGYTQKDASKKTPC